MPTIKNLTQSYGSLLLYENFSMDLKQNAITALIGPSGCGKTTLAQILSGLLPIESGDLKDFEFLAISYVFQEPRLLPWLSVRENLAMIHDEPTAINEILAAVSLTEKANALPQTLSGGQQQRVALARGFLYPSDLLILDEPFSNLDPQLKSQMIRLFKQLWIHNKKTVLLITHDHQTALRIADELFELSMPPHRQAKHHHLSLERENRTDQWIQDKINKIQT
jgi:NitT/TauT family transport system ATP-binding protein